MAERLLPIACFCCLLPAACWEVPYSPTRRSYAPFMRPYTICGTCLVSQHAITRSTNTNNINICMPGHISVRVHRSTGRSKSSNHLVYLSFLHAYSSWYVYIYIYIYSCTYHICLHIKGTFAVALWPAEPMGMQWLQDKLRQGRCRMRRLWEDLVLLLHVVWG